MLAAGSALFVDVDAVVLALTTGAALEPMGGRAAALGASFGAAVAVDAPAEGKSPGGVALAAGWGLRTNSTTSTAATMTAVTMATASTTSRRCCVRSIIVPLDPCAITAAAGGDGTAGATALAAGGAVTAGLAGPDPTSDAASIAAAGAGAGATGSACPGAAGALPGDACPAAAGAASKGPGAASITVVSVAGPSISAVMSASIAAALWYRCAGSCCIARSTILATPSDTRAAITRMEGGGMKQICAKICPRSCAFG